MKYIVLIIGLLVVGCGENRAISEWKEEKEARAKAATNTNEVDGTTEKPVKELTAEEMKVVGTYEREGGRGGWKLVLLNTGVFEVYSDGKKEEEAKWKISKDGELHAIYGDGRIIVLRINKDSSITTVADLPKEDQITYKKIK